MRTYTARRTKALATRRQRGGSGAIPWGNFYGAKKNPLFHSVLGNGTASKSHSKSTASKPHNKSTASKPHTTAKNSNAIYNPMAYTGKRGTFSKNDNAPPPILNPMHFLGQARKPVVADRRPTVQLPESDENKNKAFSRAKAKLNARYKNLQNEVNRRALVPNKGFLPERARRDSLRRQGSFFPIL